jgi:hypothetical protein
VMSPCSLFVLMESSAIERPMIKFGVRSGREGPLKR